MTQVTLPNRSNIFIDWRGGACAFEAKGMIEEAKKIISEHPQVSEVNNFLSSASAGDSLRVTGISGSLRSFVIALLAEESSRPILLVVSDDEEAQKLCDDLRLTMGTNLVRLFTGAGAPGNGSSPGVEDIETLRALLEKNVAVTVASALALSSKIPNPATLKNQVLTIETGRDYSFTRLLAQLAEFGFERGQFVQAVGDYSVRGGILDVYPFVGENPLRIEFFGDTVESIREFEPISQRSIHELSAAKIVPNLLARNTTESNTSRSTLLDFLQPNAVLVLDEPDILQRTIEEHVSDNNVEWQELSELIRIFPQIYFSSIGSSDVKATDFESLSQPSINGSVKILRSRLADLQSQEFRIFITSDTTSERDRLKDLLADLEPIAEEEERSHHDPEQYLDVNRIEFSLEAFHEGFIFPGAKVALFTEHQIFNRIKRRGKQRRLKFKGITERELHSLRKGDFVVHADYGVGRFDGLKKITVRDVEQEVVKLLYDAKDTLYVNLNYLNKVQKYASKEGHVPKLTRLGTGEWDKLKARAKKRVKDIARDLIKLYAKRKHSQGFAFQKDTLWQRELEAGFMYEDTPDQARTTNDVKQDMEAQFPMDRLVCGDVGFGKTEVAVRAAFKAVMSGKQVAVLVPTTILAQQHFNTFLDRLSKYSTRVEVISRFRSKKEQSEIIERLQYGSTDIIIGTHRLLSKDVSFKDLGLLIVDEEHRFGVTAKEKLRQFKSNVDTLTLTATPIPRTLHFSLMGARDLSIIATPPRNRLPIITEIAQYNEDHMREAILREIQRGGQVFFVHDRVHNMDEVIGRLQASMPQIRFRQAHGQMHAHELEDVMVAFLERKFDVLVATKIIESGLDIPSVNTIIINRADRFGMAELYQLRGRVGRSNVQAYAYLLTPPISGLPRETVRRLQAVEEFTELGSGFNLAMRDLEIRGAGNLLGGEQSGFIETMGFEMYTRILEEAVAELKEYEFQDLFEKVTARRESENQTVVEADFDVHIPESYIENDNERLVMYRRLYAVNVIDQLNEVASELTDRFGKYPREVENLLDLVRVRLKASKLGFRKINISATGVQIEFPPETEKDFYEAGSFQLLMSHISRKGNKNLVLRQNGKALILTNSFGKTAEANPFKSAETLLDELHSVTSHSPIEEPVS